MKDKIKEEGLKNNIIIPYLKDLGLDEGNLQFEESFQIQIGKNPQSILSNKEDIAKGRLDILVKRNDVNLFVLEVKEPNHNITDNDVKQGISYASILFPQLAPFTIITNGRITKIYETATRVEFTGKKLKKSNYYINDYHISFAPEIRYEAFKNLIELDPKNLYIFCKHQVKNRLVPLKLKVYKPEILIERGEISKYVDSFLNSDQKSLMITGNSGVGKTNYLCSLAEKLIDSHNYVLFFPAIIMSKGLESIIVEDFNWELGHNKNIIQYIKLLSSILRNENKNLIICIDAIDESVRPNSNIELNEFINRIKNEPIKLILTCKTTKADKFTSISGMPTHITNSVIYAKDSKYPLNERAIINDFTDREVDQASWRYSQFFGVNIMPFGNMRKKLKNPFLLRIFFEIYSSLPEESQQSITSHQIYQEYIKKILKKAKNKPLAINCLGQIAEKMLTSGKDQLQEQDMDQTLYESVEYLIDEGILTVTEDEKGRRLLFFASDDIKKYVTCYYALKLDTITSERLELVIQEYKNNFFVCELLVWYRKQEQDPKKRQLLQDKLYTLYEELGMEIIRKYDTFTQRNFPFLKGKEGVVFFCEPDTLSIYAYSLKDISEGDKKVSFEVEFNPDVFNRYHISSVRRAFGYLFEDMSLIEEIKDYTLYKIKEHISNGDLDETENNGLLKERLFNILYVLHISNLLSYNPYEIIAASWVFIRLSLDSIISSGKTIHPAILEAKAIVQILEQRNIEPVSPLLPLGDNIIIGKSTFTVIENNKYKNYETTDPLIYKAHFYTNEKLIRFVEGFYHHFFIEYKALIDKNFPNHKKNFRLYNDLPCRLIGEIAEESNMRWSDFPTRSLRMCIFKDHDKSETRILMKAEKSIFDQKNFAISTDNEIIKLDTWIEWSTKNINILFAPKGVGKNNEILRQFIYDYIEKELSHNPIEM